MSTWNNCAQGIRKTSVVHKETCNVVVRIPRVFPSLVDDDERRIRVIQKVLTTASEAGPPSVLLKEYILVTYIYQQSKLFQNAKKCEIDGIFCTKTKRIGQDPRICSCQRIYTLVFYTDDQQSPGNETQTSVFS